MLLLQARFGEDYINEADPSVLRFLIASRDEVSSTQLRDDLLSMLVAGHETTGSVLTWTMYLLEQNPAAMAKVCLLFRQHAPCLHQMRSGLCYEYGCLGKALAFGRYVSSGTAFTNDAVLMDPCKAQGTNSLTSEAAPF